MSITPPPPPKQFALLARELGLSPSSANVLTILARHPDPQDSRVQQLMGELEGAALHVAKLLVGDEVQGCADTEVQLATLLRAWQASTVQGNKP